MSDNHIFHRSCFTARCLGYKYRTLSTNTGTRKHRDKAEDSTFDKKFNELQKEISLRIAKQLDITQDAREHLIEQLEKVDAKINSVLVLQATVGSLRQDLIAAENSLSNMVTKLDRIEAANSDIYSVSNKNNSLPSVETIFEERELNTVASTQM